MEGIELRIQFFCFVHCLRQLKIRVILTIDHHGLRCFIIADVGLCSLYPGVDEGSRCDECHYHNSTCQKALATFIYLLQVIHLRNILIDLRLRTRHLFI